MQLAPQRSYKPRHFSGRGHDVNYCSRYVELPDTSSSIYSLVHVDDATVAGIVKKLSNIRFSAVVFHRHNCREEVFDSAGRAAWWVELVTKKGFDGKPDRGRSLRRDQSYAKIRDQYKWIAE